MAVINDPVTGAAAEIEASGALRSVIVPRGNGYCITAVTGTIAAALGANSSVFAMRLDPGAAVKAYIERIRLEFLNIAAFTTPFAATRQLALFRGSGAATSGGTSLPTAVKKDTVVAPLSEFDLAQGGDIRVATTGALTVTGITFEADPLRRWMLSHVGALNARATEIFEFSATESHPLVLQPGQLLAIRNPVAMDAAGTWQLTAQIDWHEAAAF